MREFPVNPSNYCPQTSSKIIPKSYFSVHNKKYAKAQPIFWTTRFPDKFTLWYIKLHICILKNKVTSHKQYLFDLVFSENQKKIHIKKSILQLFARSGTLPHSPIFKSSNCKKLFGFCIRYWYRVLYEEDPFHIFKIF